MNIKTRQRKRVVQEKKFYQTVYGDITFDLIRSSARRSLSLCVNERAEVSVSVPYHCSQRLIHSFIDEKARWIDQKLKQAQKSKAILDQQRFDQGGSFLFLGKRYPVTVYESIIKRSQIKFDGESWTIFLAPNLSAKARQEQVKKRMIQWYRTQAQELLAGRIFHYARIINVEPKKIAVRTQKRVWGNCDYHNKVIHLNWQIILSPLSVIDYVVVHELCHLIVPNHSLRFWNQVRKYMPDFKQHKQWLSDHTVEMMLV